MARTKANVEEVIEVKEDPKPKESGKTVTVRFHGNYCPDGKNWFQGTMTFPEGSKILEIMKGLYTVVG